LPLYERANGSRLVRGVIMSSIFFTPAAERRGCLRSFQSRRSAPGGGQYRYLSPRVPSARRRPGQGGPHAPVAILDRRRVPPVPAPRPVSSLVRQHTPTSVSSRHTSHFGLVADPLLAHVYERRVSRAVDAQLQYVRPSIVPGDIEAVLRLDDSFQIEIGIQDCLLVVYRTGQIVAVASG